MMELRSYNVEKVWMDTVKCVIQEDLGVDKVSLEANRLNIRDMLSQVQTVKGYAHLCACNKRKDGETWTPYLQIVEMLIRLGAKLGYVKYTGRLKAETLIKIL